MSLWKLDMELEGPEKEWDSLKDTPIPEKCSLLPPAFSAWQRSAVVSYLLGLKLHLSLLPFSPDPYNIATGRDVFLFLIRKSRPRRT